MTADELAAKYAMAAHVENGAFLECHYPHDGSGRAASGSIFYYVGADEKTAFHRIDCDEYWCYTEGANLEIWQVDEQGNVQTSLLGTDGEAHPFVYLRKGIIFASRHPAGGHCPSQAEDGTFVVCITVPRFTYEGFTMYSKEQMLRDYPAVSGFYDD